MSSKLYNHSSEDSVTWSWEYFRDVESAAHGNELEMMTTGIGDAFKVYYHLVSWDESEDYSDGFWVSLGTSGARTTPTWSKHSLDSAFNAAWDVQTGDLDNDGDVDVIAVRADGAVQWWENDGSSSPSWTEYTIAGSFGGGSSIYIVDLDSDGDLDVLGSAAGTRDDIAWWENDGPPSNGGWDGHTIDDNLKEAWHVHSRIVAVYFLVLASVSELVDPGQRLPQEATGGPGHVSSYVASLHPHSGSLY